jgi:molybdopterin-guanine dinucleotide biosynthesis adapter protein
MSAIVSFIGYHDSGKTTLASQVVKRLKALGYCVGVIKSSSDTGVLFDTPDTDTYKHRQNGADPVLFVAPDQLVLQAGATDLSLYTLAHRYCPDVDIVIGEGFKHARRVAKIEVRRSLEQDLRNEVRGVIAVATDLDISGKHIFRLNESEEIASFIERRFLIGEKKRQEKTALLIDGNKIPLKDFVQEVLAGTVAGFVNSLKLTKDGKDIELRIKLNDNKN